MTWKHLMVDLETFASTSDAAVVSIGAVCFDPHLGTLGPEFKVNIRPQSAQKWGGRVSAETMTEFWFTVEQAARDAISNPKPVALGSALGGFIKWCQENLVKDFSFWANGPDFDGVILGNTYERAETGKPWKYGRHRCYRTMNRVFEGQVARGPFKMGTAHDALDDAKSQAMHLNAIFSYLRSRGVSFLSGDFGAEATAGDGGG